MKEHVWKLDLIVILVSVFLLMGLVGYARPLVIAPIDDYESDTGRVLFEFDRADVLLIDDNMEFTSPDEYEGSNGGVLILEPGVYYWKTTGVLGSEIRKLTINSRVELELLETEEGVAVVNAGNVRLNVDVYDDEELVDKVKLEVGSLSSEGDKFVGGYDDE